MTVQTTQPVTRTLTLTRPRAQAFRAFTAEVGRWWPQAFSASGEALARVAIEGHPGGRVYETDHGDHAHDWGVVTAFIEGQELALSWTLRLTPGTSSDLAVSFTDSGSGGSVVTLVHGGWGADQAADRAAFDGPDGWDTVLAAYASYVES